MGYLSPWALLWFFLFSVAPFAYIYIGLMVLRDLCIYFPDSFHQLLLRYVPLLAYLANLMNSSSKVMEVWCVIEALFYIGLKLKIRYLQNKDPLEASLSAAPMLDPDDRRILWDRMIDSEKHDPVSWITGWFFDENIDNITRYDIFDFVCWSMFDGRNQEHLTLEEERELEDFIDELEMIVSLHLYGTKDETEIEEEMLTRFPTQSKNQNEEGEQEIVRHPSTTDGTSMDETDSLFSDLTTDNDENSNHANKMVRITTNASTAGTSNGTSSLANQNHIVDSRKGGSIQTSNTSILQQQGEGVEDDDGTNIKDVSFDSQVGSKKYPQPKKSKILINDVFLLTERWCPRYESTGVQRDLTQLCFCFHFYFISVSILCGDSPCPIEFLFRSLREL